jgi:hypothetical protein
MDYQLCGFVRSVILSGMYVLPPGDIPDALLDLEDMALILNKTVITIRSDSSRAPHRLPPRVMLPSSKKLLWRRETVLSWLKANKMPPAQVVRTPAQSKNAKKHL